LNSADGVTGSKIHELQLEPGYDYVKEIARGGYGYVYLLAGRSMTSRISWQASLSTGTCSALLMIAPARRPINERWKGSKTFGL